MMRFRELHILFLFACAVPLFSTGCAKSTNKDCANLIKAISELQSEHVSTPQDFNAKIFETAQRKLLDQQILRAPEKFSSLDSQSQCTETLKLLQNNFPNTESAEWALDLMNRYVRDAWDPHSVVMPDEALANRDSIRQSYGFFIGRSGDHGKVELIDIIAPSPAYNQGLREGMVIDAIDGTDVTTLSTATLINMLKEKNTITLNVRDERTEIASISGIKRQEVVTLKRDTLMYVSPFKAETINIKDSLSNQRKQIIYVKLRFFDRPRNLGSLGELLLRTFQQATCLILDLRNIAGGDIAPAAAIANFLISKGTSFVGYLKRGMNIDDVPDEPLYLEPATQKERGGVWKAPIVVIANAGTKSVAEALTGALQDYGAVIVGAQTFGKGTHQTPPRSLHKYGFNAAIEITDAFLLRPSGQPLQLVGVSPDIEVKSSVLESRRIEKRESAIFGHLKPPVVSDPPRSLYGYSSTALGKDRRPDFHERFQLYKTTIEETLQKKAALLSQEDLELLAAREAALFLSNESDPTAVYQFE
ncbi:MAG: S41 family peptidase [Bdellovibrionota bacterium]